MTPSLSIEDAHIEISIAISRQYRHAQKANHFSFCPNSPERILLVVPARRIGRRDRATAVWSKRCRPRRGATPRAPASHFRRTIRAIDCARHITFRTVTVVRHASCRCLVLIALLLPLVPDTSALAQSAGRASRASSGRSRTASACSAAKPISSATSPSWRNDGVLGSERRLAVESDGRGWARDTVERLCVDRAGRLMEFCERDGTREVYLSPGDHRIGVVLAGRRPTDAVDAPGRSRTARASRASPIGSCDEEMRLRVVYGQPDHRHRRHRAAGRHRPARGRPRSRCATC